MQKETADGARPSWVSGPPPTVSPVVNDATTMPGWAAKVDWAASLK
jgi:hypothetical protein